MLTRRIALTYAARGIRCSAILRGLMDTPLNHKSITGVYGDDDETVKRHSAICTMGVVGNGRDVAFSSWCSAAG